MFNLKIKITFKVWLKKNVSQEIRLKDIDKIRNYLVEETNHYELISKKHKKVCTTLNYIKNFLILNYIITGCVSIYYFDSLMVFL